MRMYVRSCTEPHISEYYTRLSLFVVYVRLKCLLLRVAKVAIFCPHGVWRFSLLRHGQFVNKRHESTYIIA